MTAFSKTRAIPVFLDHQKTRRAQDGTPPRTVTSSVHKRKARKADDDDPQLKRASPADHPDPSDLRHCVRLFAERETEALAIKTVQLAKRGHAGALAFVFECMPHDHKHGGASALADLGSLTRLDEIADGQRKVIAAAAEGHITPTDAIHYMKMLNELGQAIKNSDIQAEIDELRSYVHGA